MLSKRKLTSCGENVAPRIGIVPDMVVLCEMIVLPVVALMMRRLLV
jgi:hypothetical protein